MMVVAGMVVSVIVQLRHLLVYVMISRPRPEARHLGFVGRKG
jgi:hypothetical protein